MPEPTPEYRRLQLEAALNQACYMHNAFWACLNRIDAFFDDGVPDLDRWVLERSADWQGYECNIVEEFEQFIRKGKPS